MPYETDEPTKSPLEGLFKLNEGHDARLQGVAEHAAPGLLRATGVASCPTAGLRASPWIMKHRPAK